MFILYLPDNTKLLGSDEFANFYKHTSMLKN